ncbi:hypothetical protein GGR88_000290 [Sphingomonas jejuensis]|uniref:Uncharacterized protein n=1 Tax=Sphingomonas jejuensis TaxID=904715 RepID=A0ABX0XHK9_9SPHN|nr:DUF6127 family protein [Sphingomonas jejuensis]NJC32816.1 hypothetical protein [Sphingomonas jejuensis]
MDDGAVLAELVRQAEGDGAGRGTLRAIVEEASERGAARALASIGLQDAAAGGDMGELRELLAAWRDVKRSARRAAVEWMVRLLLAALLLGLAVKLGVRA